MDAVNPTPLQALWIDRFTLEELAERTKFSRAHLCEVGQGKTGAGPKLIQALARALKKDVSEIRTAIRKTQRKYNDNQN
jgi:transcriptional regulator with XRE-family HTH domain